MSLIKRARLVAATAIVALVGLSNAPQIASALHPEGPSIDGHCYEQVPEYRYEREVPEYDTEYLYIKQARLLVTHQHPGGGEDVAEVVNDWGRFGDALMWSSSDVDVLLSGVLDTWDVQHDDHVDHFVHEYRYVKNGETRQIPTGGTTVETTDWVAGPPAGDGWTQIDERTVDGDEIPCGVPPVYPPEVVENWDDCTTGADEVTGTRTTTNYVAEYDYDTATWVKVIDGEPTVETISRALTDDEREACAPTDTTPPANPTVRIAAVSPVCHLDAPYIEVTLGGDAVFNGRAGTITLLDVNGTQVAQHTITFQTGQTLRFLYPGATVDAAGNGTDWPGWDFVDGQWVPDASDAVLRQGLTVVLAVNPTDTATVRYPGATEGCTKPEQVSSNGPETPGTEGMMLPATGSPSLLIAAISGVLLLAGTAVLWGTRVRKTAA